jgi:hypothetical protein
MATSLEQTPKVHSFEMRLLAASNRLASAVGGFEKRLSTSRAQVQKIQLIRQLWTFGRYLPAVLAVGASLLKIARTRPVLSVLLTGIAGYYLNRWVNSSQEKPINQGE